MKPTLFLLAAGMGSRYGGLKQLDGLGPNGETIMDYSIYDAIQAGFGKIVWVIRKDFEEQFRTQILSKYEGKVQCELCFQALDALPEGFTVPEGRQKPWGTNHAVLMGKDIIKEPFCVINCDDFYGRDCFMQIGKFLSNLPEGAKNQYAMVGFRVCNTLSENGSVARGVCAYDDKRHLTDVVERTEILRMDGVIKYKDEQGEWTRKLIYINPYAKHGYHRLAPIVNISSEREQRQTGLNVAEREKCQDCKNRINLEKEDGE